MDTLKVKPPSFKLYFPLTMEIATKLHKDFFILFDLWIQANRIHLIWHFMYRNITFIVSFTYKLTLLGYKDLRYCKDMLVSF